MYRLNRFRDYLIDNASSPARPIPPLDMSPRAILKRDYETYLRVQRGLSHDTIYHCLRFYDRFLTAKFGPDLGDLNSIKPVDISGFILRLREAQNAPRDKTGPSHLRNLFQFLFWSGKTKRNLSSAVPKARQSKPTGIAQDILIQIQIARARYVRCIPIESRWPIYRKEQANFSRDRKHIRLRLAFIKKVGKSLVTRMPALNTSDFSLNNNI